MRHRTATSLLATIATAAAALTPLLSLPRVARATVPPAHPVISEVAWAGSSDSTLDEWIELQNPTASTIDLSGWRIVDDAGAQSYALSGTIAPGGYYLIEKREVATSVPADLVVSGLSLANDGDRLELRDPAGATVDDVNPTGGAWAAGSATSHASMERTSPGAAPGDAASWGSSTASGPATSSAGAAVRGTPRAANSVATPGPTSGLQVRLQVPPGDAAPGSTVELTLVATGASDLLSYGLDLSYPPAAVSAISASEGPLLAGSPPESTAFQSALVDGQPGRLRIAGTRLTTPPSGASGSGTLATVTLTLAAGASGSVVLDVAPGAFAASPTGDLPATFSGAQVTVGSSTPPVSALSVQPGAARYSLQLSWTAPSGGADSYRVRRRDPSGAMVQVGTSATTSFTDDDTSSTGGAIIPTRSYHYDVVAVRAGVASAAVSADGSDPRGVLGDSTRDDGTDGRDLTLLARSWGTASDDAGFSRLADTSIDGAIDGDDLVDLAAHWALTYAPAP